MDVPVPRFSVIVPAYQVQAYLPECLDSVLTQSFPDLELIAVDDASPDACGEVIDAYAARDTRVKPVHLPRNAGLGPARNAGLAHAGGDYVVFLDGDDTLTPGALRAIADRIEATGEPDVLVYDYARTYWTGEARRNKAAAQLTEQGPAPFRIEDRPGLLTLLMVAWNKAYRREFVEREGLTFPPGYYEDTPWTYPALLTARSVATLDRVCVHYRQRRRGSILGTTSDRHFDVFAQYDRLFAFLAERPELAHWRPVLFRRMLEPLTVVFTRPGRLPRTSRAAFLRAARAHCRRHRTPAAAVPPASGTAGAGKATVPGPSPRTRLRHALVRLGLHRTFRLLGLAAAVLRRTRGTAARLRGAVRTALLRVHHRLQRCLPLRADWAVFTAQGGHGGDPAALEAAFREFAPHIRTAWVARPEHRHTVPPGIRRLTPGTAAYFTALARAAYLVDDSPLAHSPLTPRPAKRAGQIVLQTHQGTPLAHTGLDLQERPAAARGTDFARLLDGVDQWDYALSANRHSTLTHERVYPGSYATLEYGRPCTDVFHTATAEDVARLREALGVPREAVAVLYAPAPRDHLRTQRPFLDLERVLRRLGPGFVVLARTAHPPAAPGAPGLIDVSRHPGVESLCLAADVLVTDYASLMVDYAVLDRPIVLYTPDREVFEATRGSYVDLWSDPPGAVAHSEDELIDVFTAGHWRDARAERLRAAFRERFCPHDDGRVAERVVRRVVYGQTDEASGLPPVVPLAERRPAPPAAARARSPLATVPQPAGFPAVTESH
jgi:CRISPR system Cascade subunit CasB